jgi:hypothetical protein
MKHATYKTDAISLCPTPSEKEDFTRRREQLLDEALKQTFPASDPPSITMQLER